jgi:hypothetical protein
MTNKSISQLTAGAAVSSTDVFPDVQTTGVGPVKVTAAQIGDYVLSGSGLTGVLPVSRGGTGLTSLGTGVATALGNAVNGASGLCVQDAAGNLGLGVTPSAWDSAFKTLQIGAVSAVSCQSSVTTVLSANTYYNSSTWKYISASLGASRYDQYNGNHYWHIAGSGSAGGTISFTQAMTLDASGNLALGTSSASSRLHIVATSSDLASAFGNVAVFSNDSQAQDKGGSIGFGGVYTGTSIAQWAGIRGAKENGTDGNFAGYMSFFTRANGGSTTERARITSAGDLLVGTTSSGSGKIVVNNTPTSQWGIDFAQSTVTVANNSNATIPAGSGIIILTDGSQTGCTGMYIVGGGGVALVSGTTSGGGTTLFVTPTTTPAAGKACVAYDGANYRIYNNQGNSIGFTVAMLRSRNSN